MTGELHPTTATTGRHVSTDNDGRAAAAADVDAVDGTGTVHAVLYGEVSPIPGDAGSRLVDAVLELPEVAAADRLEAAVPTADADMIQRLQECTDDVQTRRAGATVLIDAQIRHPADQEPQAAETPTP